MIVTILLILAIVFSFIVYVLSTKLAWEKKRMLRESFNGAGATLIQHDDAVQQQPFSDDTPDTNDTLNDSPPPDTNEPFADKNDTSDEAVTCIRRNTAVSASASPTSLAVLKTPPPLAATNTSSRCRKVKSKCREPPKLTEAEEKEIAKSFVYMPSTDWLTAKERDPPCIPKKKNVVQPVFTVGTPANALNYFVLVDGVRNPPKMATTDASCYTERAYKRVMNLPSGS